MIKTFFILFCLISITANAQYSDNYLIDDLQIFIVKNVVNKNIRDKDAEVLHTNKVKEVYIKNEDGIVSTILLINNFGFIEEYITFNEQTDLMESQWRFGYDANNNMTAASQKEGRIRINYIFTYENNLIASIYCSSDGKETQYDFAHMPDGKIMKMTLLEFQTYTKLDVNYFNYDSDGKFINLTDENQNILYETTYDNNTVNIRNTGSFKNTYTYLADRITEESYTFYSKRHLGVTKQIDAINFTEKYSYDEKNLVKDVQLKSSKTSESKETYEYVYYN